MLDGIKKYWRGLKAGQPGKRFQQQYKKQHATGTTPWHKVLFLGGGVLIMLAGIFFLPAPGPGWVIIFIGAGMVAQDSERAAKILDWCELRIRDVVDWAQKVWKQSPTWARVLYVLITLAIVA